MNDLDGLRAALDGDLLTSASPGYDTARYPAMARYRDVRPQAFVRCASTQDVVRAIGYARDTGAQVVPRGGGHCFAGRYSTEGLVLDLGRLNAITVGPDGRARIRAGARLAQVYDALHNRRADRPGRLRPDGRHRGAHPGRRARPARPDAWADLRRAGRRGVVLADGRIVDCDADREPELLWARAARAAGSSAW